MLTYLNMEKGKKKYDIVLLTDSRYVSQENPDWYMQNILADTFMKVANQQ